MYIASYSGWKMLAEQIYAGFKFSRVGIMIFKSHLMIFMTHLMIFIIALAC